MYLKTRSSLIPKSALTLAGFAGQQLGQERGSVERIQALKDYFYSDKESNVYKIGLIHHSVSTKFFDNANFENINPVFQKWGSALLGNLEEFDP